MLLYQAYQAQRDLTAPVRAAAGLACRALGALPPPLAANPALRRLSATYELMARSALTHTRPAYGIDSVRLLDGREAPVVEEAVVTTPFGTLLHFAKPGVEAQPRVLVVAALAGHFATLLRDTVATLLQDHDVWITDWHNARDIGLQHGPFGLDDYIDHVIDFLGAVGPGAHLLSVCQPCPAVLAATSVMAEGRHPATPRSLTLMAGPVDTRISPTAVNDLAQRRPLAWFEQNVIATVPLRYPGAGRRVYPGFLQVAGFMSLNARLHASQHQALFQALVDGDDDRARTIEDFYDEYFAVLDLPAEFYLETVDAVFQRHLLPLGQLTYRGRRVDPGAIRRTALLTVEGERDDICGLGQTLAAHDLVRVPPARRAHHLQAGAGHYGVFSGSRWRQQVYPVVRNTILAND